MEVDKMKKGFTLIELLAVIVILAIIALIATPIIISIIENTKGESEKRSIELYASAVKNAMASYQLTHPNAPISINDLTVEYDGDVKCSINELYEDGSIHLDQCTVNGNEVDYSYGTSKYVYMKNLNGIMDAFDRSDDVYVEYLDFYNDGRVPEDVHTEVDVSVDGDNSIMLYFYDLEGDYSPDGIYFHHAMIVSKDNKKISFPVDSSSLFIDFAENGTTFNFNNSVYTGNVVNMSSMFEYLNYGGWYASGGVFGLENWDTSNVTNMSNMFSNVPYAPNLDLSNWNTSSVTNMSGMFSDFGRYGAGLIKLSNWDTSNVTNMSRMFAYAAIDNTLDLTSFDTSKVTDMSNMFYYNAIKEIKVSRSKWDISNADTTNFIYADEEEGGSSTLTYVD